MQKATVSRKLVKSVLPVGEENVLFRARQWKDKGVGDSCDSVVRRARMSRARLSIGLCRCRCAKHCLQRSSSTMPCCDCTAPITHHATLCAGNRWHLAPHFSACVHVYVLNLLRLCSAALFCAALEPSNLEARTCAKIRLSAAALQPQSSYRPRNYPINLLAAKQKCSGQHTTTSLSAN